MLDISAQLGTFDAPLHPDVMAGLIFNWVVALQATNLAYLQAYPDTVPLYQSGIYYQAEEIGKEDFFDIPTLLIQGYGDCEDLSAWRAAEYQSVGYWAQPLVTWEAYENRRSGIIDITFHVRVQTQLGIEDPSALLGMK